MTIKPHVIHLLEYGKKIAKSSKFNKKLYMDNNGDISTDKTPYCIYDKKINFDVIIQFLKKMHLRLKLKMVAMMGLSNMIHSIVGWSIV